MLFLKPTLRQLTTKPALRLLEELPQTNPTFMQNIKTTTDSELCEIITKILNISRREVIQNIDLFRKINYYTLNSLYYLSKFENDQDKITALYSLEFVYNFHERVDK